jgi:glycosyltransferase involved in cell wall biosynthesis
MKVLTLSTVFPNPAQPVHGLFVFERARHAAARADVRVVAPVPWYRRSRAIPRTTTLGELRVEHPTFFYVPGILKVLDGFFLFLSVLPRVRRMQREFDFDVIDAHFAFPEGFAAILLGRWFGKPVMITLRGSEHEFVAHPPRKKAIAWALARATRVVAVSHQLARLAEELGVPRDRIALVENGVDVDTFRPLDQADARRAIGVDGTGPLLISVGHLVPLKGHHRMIRAVAELRSAYPGLALALVGGSASTSGGYPDELKQLSNELGLSSSVLFPGALPPAQVCAWLNAADVFVLCSDREGCPNVVWESLACGVPVASAKVGEVEYMVPSRAGVLFDDPADPEALRAAVSRALDRRWDRADIRAHAEAHTWALVAQRVERQWHLCLDHRGLSVDTLTPVDADANDPRRAKTP